MAEVNQVIFDHKELAEILVKKAGLSEGLWGLYIEFGLGAANMNIAPANTVPAAIVSVLKIGIQRFDKPSSLTFDATDVKARQKPATESRSKKSRKRPAVQQG